ncbi:MAG: signal peptidase I [Ruminococcaceae bacterium]|nr:signal peptidase I [Oscillospiraceae bacterium]
MQNILGKIWNAITTLIVVIVVVLAVILMGARLLGFRVFNVISGSMAPQYNVGDLIYVKEVKPHEVKVGDPITFVLNENLVVATHRVVEINSDDSYFITKGDANNTNDAAPVHFNNLIGVPKFKIPYLGYASDFIQNPPGTYISIAIAAALAMLVFLPDLFKKKKQEAPEQNDSSAPVEQ